MSATGLDVFDKTLQTTNIWLTKSWPITVRTGKWPGTYWVR
jgi:hypothetical protein